VPRFRPFPGIRYDPARVALGDVVSPPYDVIDERQRAHLAARSPHNAVRIDLPVDDDGEDGEDRYAVAHRLFAAWQADGVLRRDPRPTFTMYRMSYLDDAGVDRHTTGVIGALELSPPGADILPHEQTTPKARSDRLDLLRACRANLSAIWGLSLAKGLTDLLPVDGEPTADVDDGEGVRHTAWTVDDPDVCDAVAAAVAAQPVVIADGHHRYETGLNYRNLRRASATSWTGEEPENFILAALVSAQDPGLVVLPTHRLLKLPQPLRIQLRNLRHWRLEDAGVANDANLGALISGLQRAGRDGPAFGAIGLEPGRLHLLTPRDLTAIANRTPAGQSSEWRRLDVIILDHAVLPAVGFDGQPEHIDYTESHRHAAEVVESGAWDVAFLLNPTLVSQVFAIATARDRMPRKSTFFYPKLATGVLMYLLD
jgi:uncharacterized protein (DUF1015 family)